MTGCCFPVDSLGVVSGNISAHTVEFSPGPWHFRGDHSGPGSDMPRPKLRAGQPLGPRHYAESIGCKSCLHEIEPEGVSCLHYQRAYLVLGPIDIEALLTPLSRTILSSSVS